MPSITCNVCGGRISFDTTENMNPKARAEVKCSDTKACAQRVHESEAAKQAGVRRSPRGFVENRERGVYQRTASGLTRRIEGETREAATVV